MRGNQCLLQDTPLNSLGITITHPPWSRFKLHVAAHKQPCEVKWERSLGGLLRQEQLACVNNCPFPNMIVEAILSTVNESLSSNLSPFAPFLVVQI